MKSNVTVTPDQPGTAAIQRNGDAGRKTANRNNRALPPDPENMNAYRARWAEIALRAFQKATGADAQDAVCDLLCDLMHLSDRSEFGFEAALGRARKHYEAETEGEEAP